MLAAQGVKENQLRSLDLLPNKPPQRDTTLEEEFAAFEAYSKAYNAKWQSNPSAD